MEPIICKQRYSRGMSPSWQTNTLGSNNENKSNKNNRRMSSIDIKVCQVHPERTINDPTNHQRLIYEKKVTKCHRNHFSKRLPSDLEHTECHVSNDDESSLIRNCDCAINNKCVCRQNFLRLFNKQSNFTSFSSAREVESNHRFNCRRKSLQLGHLWQACMFLFISLICVSSADQCALGLKTSGRTWPAGDIVLEYGKPLRILCMLNKTYIDATFPGKNASDLVFFRYKKEMEPEFITILNETTIEMYVEKPPPANDMYYCKLRFDVGNTKKYEPVCLNNVAVGFKPQRPTNFTCFSLNWETLSCKWDPIPNYVETRVSLLFKLPGRAGGRMTYHCPFEKEDAVKRPPNTCIWDISTDPIYRQPYEYFTFVFIVENVLGNETFQIRFHHYAQVIPSKPANLTVVNKTSENALLYWSLPFPMKNFPPGLHHRIAYQHQWDTEKMWKIINIKTGIRDGEKLYNLTGLEYANTVYDVRVFLKSAVAVEENKWSNFSDVTFRTLPRLPGQSPKTDLGSFEITENSASRDVYLYWQSIPPYLENGDNFKYQIANVEENGRKILLTPNETTRTYAKFKGISFNSYRFKLIATNDVGANPEIAQIIIPSRSDMPREPVAFTKIAFDNGLYELSWKPPLISLGIKNYTIFWCDNERDRPYQCTGYLDWVHVPSTTTIYNVTVPDPGKVYQFAISVNTETGSSGMIWASCTVIHNRVVGKMKSVWINRIDSNFIEVSWKLDCSDRIGIIEGFNIFYCPIISPYKLECKEPLQNVTIRADPHTIHGVVRGLKPYTTYKITVAVLTKNGEGLPSDALYNTTLEAAPTTPPQNVVVRNVTNSTMFVSWEPPLAMNGVLRYYEVHYSGNSQKVEESTHVLLKDLLAYKNYSISISACTVSCSIKSEPIYQSTEIGVPGKINREPIVRFINSSQVAVIWPKPLNPGGHLNYYQIITNENEIQNSTKLETKLAIPDCEAEGRGIIHKFRVRAVNVGLNGENFFGPWSNAGEGNCYGNQPSFKVWVIIWIVSILSCLAFIICLVYGSKRMWLKCKAMQDVEVKLPPGLQREKLLQKVGEQHIRQSSTDSSGCSSGQESVTSSLTSNSHVSTDSGTEIEPVVSENKLLEPSAAWESSSLRQRNVGTMRPGGSPDNARWESYGKIPKTVEAPLDDSLSLARSTPNLTENSGYMVPQQAWSSTGYISMPSSEELSTNSSPVPKESAINHTAYSVVGVVDKSTKCKLDNESESLNSDLLTSKEEAKPCMPYVSFACLEKKPIEKQKPIVDSLKSLDDLTFIEASMISKLEGNQSVTSLDKSVSKPYVQAGMLDSLKKIPSTSIVEPKKQDSKQIIGPSNFPDIRSKTFASTFSSPKASKQLLNVTKPYVTVGAIPELIKSNKASVVEDSHHQEEPRTSAGDSLSKPYVLASPVFPVLQQKSTIESPAFASDECDVDKSSSTNYSNCWKTASNENIQHESPKITSIKKSSGYVAVADLPKNEGIETKKITPYVQHQRFEKQTMSNASSTDEQYSKVTAAPFTMQ